MIKPGDEPIPGYRVEQMLGRGQYGEVWRATTPGRSSVALKVLDMTGRRGWKEFRAVQRVKQIRHAHLMPIVAIWLQDKNGNVLDDDQLDGLAAKEDTEMLVADTVAYEKPPARMIIATLLADVSLRDRLEECQDEGLDGIPVDELMSYMQETAKGIDFLNSMQHAWAGGQVGVQHCDIKPDNVMLVGGSVVICDFGVAQILADAAGSARATSLSGSPAYMAPEAFEARPSQTSDQYSLAVTYYELRTSELPVDIDSFAAAFEAHRSGKLNFSHVPRRERAVLSRATHFDPEKRYESAAEFVEALRQATQPEPAPQSRSYAWALLLLLLVGGGGTGLWAAWNWWTSTVRVALQFDLPSANITINGETYQADADGLLNVTLPVDESTVVKAVDNDDRKDVEWTIDPSAIAEQEDFEFSIPFTPAHFASQAEELLANGEVQKAAGAYATALTDDDRLALLPAPQQILTDGMLWGDCLLLSPDGDRLVTGGRDGSVRMWDINSQGVSSTSTVVHRHASGGIVSQATSDSIVASVCDQGVIRVAVDGQSRVLDETDRGEARLAITRDGKFLVAAVPDGLTTQVIAWDLESQDIAAARQTIGSQPGEFPLISSCRNDDVVLATVDNEALVWRWRLKDKQHAELGRHASQVFTLSVAADGNVAAYAGAAPPTPDSETAGAAIVDLQREVGYRLASTQSDSILASALDAQGSVLATAERIGQFDDTGAVVTWRPRPGTGTAAMERLMVFDPRHGDVTSLVVSGDARWVAAGHETGAISLWHVDLNNNRPLATYGSGDRVSALRITPNGRWLIGGARDGRILVIDLWRMEMIYRACEQQGIPPRVEPDRVTLHDRPGPRVARSRGVDAETAYRLANRPTAGLV